VSGAAPAWAAIMHALHVDAPPAAPVPPQGVVSRRVRFTPALEAARDEWFIVGTEMDEIALLDPSERGARIASPANGVIIALDPDIPPARQTVALESRGAPAHAAWRLDDVVLGHGRERLAWSPVPGAHRLELREGERVLDSVRFTVRGLR
ncbi:MAG: penicillin-binding protein 1C, partial [Gammaproteobacteria bacterium]